jgi:hypothetical protein
VYSLLGSHYLLSNKCHTGSTWTTWLLLHGIVAVLYCECVRLKSWPKTVVFWFCLVLSSFRYATPASFLIHPSFFIIIMCYVTINIIWGDMSFQFSRRQNSIKSFWADSRVRWFKSTDVSETESLKRLFELPDAAASPRKFLLNVWSWYSYVEETRECNFCLKTKWWN